MPELGPKDLSSVRILQKKVNSFTGLDDFAGEHSNTLNNLELNSLAKTYGQKYVDNGAEVVIIRHKDKPDTLLALNFEDVESKEAKQIFYLHRLFSILFPHNFPHFYASTGINPKYPRKSIFGTIRQEIKRTKKALIFGISDVKKICKQLDIDLHLDEEEENLIRGMDGGEYFVDTIHPDEVSGLNQGKILKYMEEHEYKLEDIAAVKMSLERLKALGQDVK